MALAILILGGLVAIGLWSWLAARAGRPGGTGPRSGEESRRDRSGALGLRSARAILEDREALEAEDLVQLLAAHNAWRRRRGRPERSVEDIELIVAREREEIRRGGGAE